MFIVINLKFVILANMDIIMIITNAISVVKLVVYVLLKLIVVNVKEVFIYLKEDAKNVLRIVFFVQLKIIV